MNESDLFSRIGPEGRIFLLVKPHKLIHEQIYKGHKRA